MKKIIVFLLAAALGVLTVGFVTYKSTPRVINKSSDDVLTAIKRLGGG